MKRETAQKPPEDLSLEMLWNMYQDLSRRVDAITSFDGDYAANYERIDWARIAAEAKEEVAKMKSGDCLSEEDHEAFLDRLERMIDEWQPPHKEIEHKQEMAVV